MFEGVICSMSAKAKMVMSHLSVRSLKVCAMAKWEYVLSLNNDLTQVGKRKGRFPEEIIIDKNELIDGANSSIHFNSCATCLGLLASTP